MEISTYTAIGNLRACMCVCVLKCKAVEGYSLGKCNGDSTNMVFHFLILSPYFLLFTFTAFVEMKMNKN